MDRFQSILNNVARHVLRSAEETDYFTALLRFKRTPAGTFLLRQGDDCPYFYYVLTGALRGYFTDKNGKESTIMFALPDWWITDMGAFAGGRPAMIHIEAMTDSELGQIEKNELENLYGKYPLFERYFRILMQNAYIREQTRITENLSLPALDRYNSFLKKYPQAAALITQKQLASYLGISPEFLSSIKGKKHSGS